jgi:5-hydroxyisourate hydrolase
MVEAGPTISTHVLDVGLGRPAQGVRVTLERIVHDGAAVVVGEASTDADGRIGRLLEGELAPGTFRLSFHLEDAGGFFRHVSLEVEVQDVSRGYHVPLLVAPYGITSYRGS